MASYDYIIIGSGINALVAAALLGRKGRKVLVLERNDRIGGCLRTEEITAPGFRHDVMATTMCCSSPPRPMARLARISKREGLNSRIPICRRACFAPMVRM